MRIAGCNSAQALLHSPAAKMLHLPGVAAAALGRSAAMRAGHVSARQRTRAQLQLLLPHTAGSSAGLALRKGCWH